MNIVKLKKSDIKQAADLLVTLDQTMIKKRQDIFVQSVIDREEFLTKKLTDKEYIMYVAKKEEEIVGVCTAVLKHVGNGIETNLRDILFVEYLAVKEDFKRQKIGTMLIEKMKQEAKDNNVLSLELNVWGFNKEAIKFYDSCYMTPKRIVYEFNIKKERD